MFIYTILAGGLFHPAIKDSFRHRMERCLEASKKDFFPSTDAKIYNYMSNYRKIDVECDKTEESFSHLYLLSNKNEKVKRKEVVK